MTSATSASRGAPRMPLPRRSAKRATSTAPAEVGQREQRFRERRQAVAKHDQRLAATQTIAPDARKHLGNRRGRLGDAFDQAERSALVPSTDTRNTGSSEWIISDERSMHRLARPRIQMTRGMATWWT